MTERLRAVLQQQRERTTALEHETDRRTAVRNLERAGVPRSDAMAMVGHLTESIYRRYAISDEASLRESAAKLDALHDSDITSPDLKHRQST